MTDCGVVYIKDKNKLHVEEVIFYSRCSIFKRVEPESRYEPCDVHELFIGYFSYQVHDTIREFDLSLCPVTSRVGLMCLVRTPGRS